MLLLLDVNADLVKFLRHLDVLVNQLLRLPLLNCLLDLHQTLVYQVLLPDVGVASSLELHQLLGSILELLLEEFDE